MGEESLKFTKLSKKNALEMGYSSDIRKRRRQHRKNARNLLNNGGFFNGYSAPGSTFWMVAQWNLMQARYI